MTKLQPDNAFFRILRKKGAVTVFLCIILSALILTESILWTAAAKRAAEADLMRCMRLQIEQSLSGCNDRVLTYYGLRSVDPAKLNSTVFSTCFRGGTVDSIRIEPMTEMTEEAIFDGIIQFMQIRMPAFFVSQILSRFQIIGQLITESSLYKSINTKGSSEWLKALSDFIAKKDEWGQTIDTILSTAEDVDISGITKKIKNFLQTVRALAERGGTTFLQAGDEIDDVLDLEAVGKLLTKYDEFYSQPLPEPMNDYILNAYAVSFLDSKITEEIQDDSRTKEENILGSKYEDLHPQNRCDLEYVLTGFDNEFLSSQVTRTLISDIRVLANLSVNLIDEEKMQESLEIATVLSGCLTLFSGGTLSASPKLLQFLVIYIWSCAEGIEDGLKLSNGEKIPVFDSKYISKYEILNEALQSDYRDYAGMLLFFVPSDKKLERIAQVIRKDAGTSMYTGVKVSVEYKGGTYVMEDIYHAYEIYPADTQ